MTPDSLPERLYAVDVSTVEMGKSHRIAVGLTVHEAALFLVANKPLFEHPMMLLILALPYAQ